VVYYAPAPYDGVIIASIKQHLFTHIMKGNNKTIWTIGHSTRSFEEFVDLLQAPGIELVVDVRSFPGSRRYPHFNKESLAVSLPAKNIIYRHLQELGGRRKAGPASENTAWRHKAFRGYADYMETDDFKNGISGLEKTALQQRTAFMCSEAVWWRCHRSMISDHLKAQGWTVLHIMGMKKEEEHPYTAPARIVNGELTYKNLPLSGTGQLILPFP
jgi:uncharacterized protein (DUF488 family)